MSKTREEREYHNRIAAMPCVLCDVLGVGPSSSTVHHIREGQGASQRASHWLVVPLCPDCHQGRHGIHGDRALLRMAKIEEMDLLAITIKRTQGVAWA